MRNHHIIRLFSALGLAVLATVVLLAVLLADAEPQAEAADAPGQDQCSGIHGSYQALTSGWTCTYARGTQEVGSTPPPQMTMQSACTYDHTYVVNHDGIVFTCGSGSPVVAPAGPPAGGGQPPADTSGAQDRCAALAGTFDPDTSFGGTRWECSWVGYQDRQLEAQCSGTGTYSFLPGDQLANIYTCWVR